MGRSAHVATEYLTSIKIVFANFYLPNGGLADAGLGAATTIGAGIEFPAGTFSQVLFASSPSGTIPNINLLFSDPVAVNIPKGSTFWVRPLWSNASGVLYNNWQNTFLGEATSLSTTSLADQTMGGTIANTAAVSHPPIAILGSTRNASVVILGDSIANGVPMGHDTEDSSASVTGFNAKVGIVARSLGSIPFLNLGEGGETAQACVSNSPARKQLWSKASHCVTQYGINDLIGGRSPAQIIADLQGIWSNLSFQKIYQLTITPYTADAGTPAPAYTTIGQQNPNVLASRAVLNDAIRAKISGCSGFFDVASALETSVDSDIWVVTPSPPYTPEGLHPNAAGYLLVPAASVISGITYP